MIDIRAIARALGGNVIGRDAVAAPGPGHGPRDRSLVVKLVTGAPDGFLVFSHAGNDFRDCRDHVRERLGMPAWQPGDGRDRHVNFSRLKAFDDGAVEIENEPRERTLDDLERTKRARAIWESGVDPRGTLAEAYLKSRAITFDSYVAGNVLRYHPRCPWRDENTGTTISVPALIAAFHSIDDNELTAIQRVALTAAGKKIGRRMLGIVRRAAVKLDPVGDTLHVAEGVETALAARQLGHAPAWALGSVGGISRFPLIEGVTRLRILGEAGEASARAVEHCGRRWLAAGRKVQLVMPSTGSDLNDELMAATP
jgi:putative DNA primase/helicase